MKKDGRISRVSKSQVWVETVIYTLIGLTLMGIVLGVVTPQINNMVDKSVMTQTIDTMNTINEQVLSALSSTGTQLELSLTIKRGEYLIDGSGDNIIYVMRGTGFLMSQPNEPTKNGDMTLLTLLKGSKNMTFI